MKTPIHKRALWLLTEATEKAQEAVEEMNDHQENLEEADAQ